MKLLSYCRKGEVSFGIGKSNGLIDLGERLKNKLPAKTITNFLTFFGHEFLEQFVNHPIDFSYSDITFFGVEPYINIINKSDDYKNKKGVSLVTDLMNNSKRYQDLKDRLDPNGYITSIPLKNLAYDIESHYFQKPNFGPIVEKNLKDKFDLFRDCSYIILGCTHYPLLKKTISKTLGEKVNLVDSGDAVVKNVILTLEKINGFSSKKNGKIKTQNFF